MRLSRDGSDVRVGVVFCHFNGSLVTGSSVIEDDEGSVPKGGVALTNVFSRVIVSRSPRMSSWYLRVSRMVLAAIQSRIQEPRIMGGGCLDIERWRSGGIVIFSKTKGEGRDLDHNEVELTNRANEHITISNLVSKTTLHVYY